MGTTPFHHQTVSKSLSKEAEAGTLRMLHPLCNGWGLVFTLSGMVERKLNAC